MVLAIALAGLCINPPIRGSIDDLSNLSEEQMAELSINPPIRGSIAEINLDDARTDGTCLNPPIRGSIAA